MCRLQILYSSNLGELLVSYEGLKIALAELQSMWLWSKIHHERFC